MYLFDPRTFTPPAAEASPLLKHLAGAFASRVAGFWPAPHAAFLTAPAERRQLVCLALTLTGDKPLPAPANGLLELPLKRALAAFIPNAPEGLRRALSHLGEVAWPADDYKTLLRLLSFGVAMKPLRHAESLTPEAVQSLALLPDDLLAAGLARWGLSPEQAGLVRDVHTRICALQGAPAAQAAARRWGRADNLPALFKAMQLDLLPEICAPPFVGTARLKPLRSKAEMAEAADRFGNCLRSRIRYAVSGEAAYYEWTDKPGAIVELWHDHLFGWRLDEAKGPKNALLAEPVRKAIIADLQSLGVHVGVRGWELESALGRAALPRFQRPRAEDTIEEMFGLED